MQLSIARIYSKLYDKRKENQIKLLELSYRVYEAIKKFIMEYKKAKNISGDNDLPKGMQE